MGIVTSSGQPMQSAARVPILISFEVEDYPGPDRDPILMGDTLVSRVLHKTLQEMQGSATSLLEHQDLNWTKMMHR